MDTVPNFIRYVEGIESKDDALKILKHVWGLLDKTEQKGLYGLISMLDLSHKSDPESKEELEEYKGMLAKHPEVIQQFNKFYTRVVTPVSAKDNFKNARVKAAAGLEKGIKELQQKHLVKSFEIKRVA